MVRTSGNDFAMAVALIALGGSVGGLVALAMLLTLGIGPVAALLVFWLGGLAATLLLAASVARSTIEVSDDVTPVAKKRDSD